MQMMEVLVKKDNKGSVKQKLVRQWCR